MDRGGCAYPHSSDSSTGSGLWASRGRCGCGYATFVCRPGGGSARLAARHWRGACSWRRAGGGSWWGSWAGRGSARAGQRCYRRRRCCCCRCRRPRQSRADEARVACLPCGGLWSARSGFRGMGERELGERVAGTVPMRSLSNCRGLDQGCHRLRFESGLTFHFHAGPQRWNKCLSPQKDQSRETSGASSLAGGKQQTANLDSQGANHSATIVGVIQVR